MVIENDTFCNSDMQIVLLTPSIFKDDASFCHSHSNAFLCHSFGWFFFVSALAVSWFGQNGGWKVEFCEILSAEGGLGVWRLISQGNVSHSVFLKNSTSSCDSAMDLLHFCLCVLAVELAHQPVHVGWFVCCALSMSIVNTQSQSLWLSDTTAINWSQLPHGATKATNSSRLEQQELAKEDRPQNSKMRLID